MSVTSAFPEILPQLTLNDFTKVVFFGQGQLRGPMNSENCQILGEIG